LLQRGLVYRDTHFDN